MLNASEILQTLRMIDQNKLDVRTITMGISLLECVPGPVEGLYDRVYDRIVRQAEHLVPTGAQYECDSTDRRERHGIGSVHDAQHQTGGGEDESQSHHRHGSDTAYLGDGCGPLRGPLA